MNICCLHYFCFGSFSSYRVLCFFSPTVIPSGSAPFFLIFRVRFFISDPNSLQHEQTRYISLLMRQKWIIYITYMCIEWEVVWPLFCFPGIFISCRLRRTFVRAGKCWFAFASILLYNFRFKVSNAYQSLIYWIKNTVRTLMLRNVITT